MTVAARRRLRRSVARSSPPSCRAIREIEIWGDGEQTRSFMYIDDIDGTIRLAESDIIEPLNIGSRRAGHGQPPGRHRRGDRRCDAEALLQRRRPEGRAGRNSDNTLIKLLNWAPSIRLEDGLEKTYKWIYDQMSGKASVANTVPTPSRRSRDRCRSVRNGRFDVTVCRRSVPGPRPAIGVTATWDGQLSVCLAHAVTSSGRAPGVAAAPVSTRRSGVPSIETSNAEHDHALHAAEALRQGTSG